MFCSVALSGLAIFAGSSFDDMTLKIFNVETLENFARGLGKCP